MLGGVVLEPLDGRAVARVTDEAHALGERLRAEELREDSIALHSETQQPQLMQSASLWITSMRSCETRYSLPSGGSS